MLRLIWNKCWKIKKCIECYVKINEKRRFCDVRNLLIIFDLMYSASRNEGYAGMHIL